MSRALSLLLISTLVGVLRSELFQVDNDEDFLLDDIDELINQDLDEPDNYPDDIGKGSIWLLIRKKKTIAKFDFGTEYSKIHKITLSPPPSKSRALRKGSTLYLSRRPGRSIWQRAVLLTSNTAPDSRKLKGRTNTYWSCWGVESFLHQIFMTLNKSLPRNTNNFPQN